MGFGKAERALEDVAAVAVLYLCGFPAGGTPTRTGIYQLADVEVKTFLSTSIGEKIYRSVSRRLVQSLEPYA